MTKPARFTQSDRERILTDEATRITGLCERTLQNLASKGEVWGAAKLGRRWTFDRNRLRAWVSASEVQNESRGAFTSATAFSTRVSPSMGESSDNPLRRAIERKLKGASIDG